MPYQKPICDCGEPLLIHERMGTELKYKITKEGRRKKSSIKSKKLEVIEVTNLECQKCGVAYEIQWDDKKRVIRGEKI